MRVSRALRARLAFSASALLTAAFLVARSGDAPPQRASLAPSSEALPGAGASPAERAEAARAVSADASAEAGVPAWVREALDLGEGEAAALQGNLSPLDAGDLHPTDLAVLAAIIRANRLDESSSPFDYDDGDGVFEPWELGHQVWRDGRLVVLALGPSPRFSFGYGLERLPESLGDLAGLQVLHLHGNALGDLPESVGSLAALRELRLDDNRLRALPAGIAGLTGLRRLYLGRNELSLLPRELGALESLERLAADDNPLRRIDDGALAPSLRALDVGRTHGARGDPPSPRELLAELPEAIAYRPIEELRVGGNRLYCGGGSVPAYLVDGSIRSVTGLDAQRCSLGP